VDYRINEDGIRAERRYAVPKPAGVARIVMLGDSVLFGLGVAREATFAARVENALGVEVINGGIGGYNTAAERIWFESRGRAYEPDCVVLVYCPNDVDDPVDHFVANTLQRLSHVDEVMIPNPEYHARATASRAASPDPLTASPKPNWRVQASELGVWAMRHSALATVCLRPFAHGSSRPYERCLLSEADSHSNEIAWLRQQLTRLHADVNVPAYLVYVPLAYELNSNNSTYRRGRENVARAAVDAGFQTIDVTGPLEAVGVPYLDVTHLSPAGHAVVADALVSALRKTFTNR
jgi:lysophospholipase L1-like esterase